MIELLDSVTLVGLLINCVRQYSVTVEAYTGQHYRVLNYQVISLYISFAKRLYIDMCSLSGGIRVF